CADHAIPTRVSGFGPNSYCSGSAPSDHPGYDSMRITEGMNYLTLLREMALTQQRVQTAQNEVSSGKRVSVPSDDPAAASDILRLNSEGIEADQYSRNLTSGQPKLQIADTALDGVQQMLLRAQTLGQVSLSDNQPGSAYVA